MKEIEEYFTKADLLPAIVQEAETGEVLMLAYMNRESFQKTLETGYTWFYDKDTVLITVVQTGGACHTGAHSCFFREIGKEEML